MTKAKGSSVTMMEANGFSSATKDDGDEGHELPVTMVTATHLHPPWESWLHPLGTFNPSSGTLWTLECCGP